MPSKNSGAGRLGPPPGMGPKEKKYVAQMVNAPMAAANRRPGARRRASCTNCARPGLATRPQAMNAKKAATGRYPSAVNLESTAEAPVSPKSTDRFQVGASAHRTSEKKAAPRQAARAKIGRANV